MKTALVIALLMFTANSGDKPYEFMITDSIGNCLELKREAERNTNSERIRWSCREVKAELEIVHGKLHINKLIEE
tara:strand:+ start:320 stop:544 length:225 start_codon:yes stop_codon:yes gene_type:complete